MLFLCVGSMVLVGDAQGHECWRSVVVVCVVSGLVVGVLSVSRVVCASGGRSVPGCSVEVSEFFVSSLVQFVL